MFLILKKIFLLFVNNLFLLLFDFLKTFIRLDDFSASLEASSLTEIRSGIVISFFFFSTYVINFTCFEVGYYVAQSGTGIVNVAGTSYMIPKNSDRKVNERMVAEFAIRASIGVICFSWAI